jgi:aspartyl-tRNA(Asn)/glutamyl-tRNA(Gln) amidotransferase subunit C
MSTAFSPQQVQHIADLAAIPLTKAELAPLAKAFSETLDVVANLQEIDTTKVEPVHQVTGLENITRDDTVDESRMFSQEQALANAKETHQGYIVVPAVLKHK